MTPRPSGAPANPPISGPDVESCDDLGGSLIQALARTPGVAPFAGTERYRVCRCLGEGGFGVVYEVDDWELGRRVALKTLKAHRSELSANVRRLKREFRSAADLVHPNLVGLHELSSDGARWFFTMDLVRGTDFLEYVRGETEPSGATAAGGGSPLRGSRGMVSDARLRASLPQLVAGVTALHQAGVVHRDLKPSNVLIEPDGRLVILDFGLAGGEGPGDRDASMDLAGTPAYMAPEQATGGAVTAASDWYAVGVMLYEALTGARPFEDGSPGSLMNAKASRDPEPPSKHGPVPADLERLCMALLAREPEGRPDARAIVEMLGDDAPLWSVEPRRDAAGGTFIGRARELESLRAAYEAVRRGEPMVVRIHGQAGVGKSALVARFLDDVHRQGDAAVLAGPCHERESVPFKAFDGVVDTLVRYLRSLPRSDAAALMPRDIHLVTQLFPALEGVAAVRSVPVRKRLDPAETRTNAFAAIKELIARIADRQPLVIAIDDLQWGDVDSARLLAQLLAPPERAAVLLVICYRADHDEESPVLRETLRLSEATSECGVEIALQPLPTEDAERLAASLVGGGSSESARSIAQRGEGHPLFMAELARATIRPDRSDGPPPTLLEILWQRVARLSDASRALLQTVAVAGRPLSAGLCFEAAGLGASGVDALRALRAEQLVVAADGGSIGVFHDRVREAVLGHLSPAERRDHHQRLAVALEGSNRAMPETLAIHWGGAGEPEKALAYTRIAANEAEQALAFDRAARLYRHCLDLLPPRSAEAAAIHAQLGDALANAGRGPEAAHAYLAAAELVGREDAARLNAKAAGELLRSGHVDSSIEVLRPALAELDLPLPKTQRAVLMSLLGQRVLIRLRGLGFKQRPASEVRERDLTRVDVSWALASGFSLIDVLRGAEFQARNLRLALAAGEPGRIARALSLEAAYRFSPGTRGDSVSAARTLALAEDLAHRLGNPPHMTGLSTLVAGLGGVCMGKWDVAEDATGRAETILRDHCNGVGWELKTARLLRLWALWHLGRVRDIAERLPAALRESEDRGDLFAVTYCRTFFTPMALLAADQPDQALEEGNRAVRRWSQRGFHLQHCMHLFAATQVNLYRGDYATAHRDVVDAWPALQAFLRFSAQMKTIVALHTRARAELAQGRASGDASLVESALGGAKAIEKERSGWGDGLAQLLRAGAEDALGRPERARASLERAIELLDSTKMQHFAAAARRRLGLVAGRDDLVEEADRALVALGFANPVRIGAMLAPGFAAADRMGLAVGGKV